MDEASEVGVCEVASESDDDKHGEGNADEYKAKDGCDSELGTSKRSSIGSELREFVIKFVVAELFSWMLKLG